MEDDDFFYDQDDLDRIPNNFQALKRKRNLYEDEENSPPKKKRKCKICQETLKNHPIRNHELFHPGQDHFNDLIQKQREENEKQKKIIEDQRKEISEFNKFQKKMMLHQINLTNSQLNVLGELKASFNNVEKKIDMETIQDKMKEYQDSLLSNYEQTQKSIFEQQDKFREDLLKKQQVMFNQQDHLIKRHFEKHQHVISQQDYSTKKQFEKMQKFMKINPPIKKRCQTHRVKHIPRRHNKLKTRDSLDMEVDYAKACRSEIDYSDTVLRVFFDYVKKAVNYYSTKAILATLNYMKTQYTNKQYQQKYKISRTKIISNIKKYSEVIANYIRNVVWPERLRESPKKLVIIQNSTKCINFNVIDPSTDKKLDFYDCDLETESFKFTALKEINGHWLGVSEMCYPCGTYDDGEFIDKEVQYWLGLEREIIAEIQIYERIVEPGDNIIMETKKHSKTMKKLDDSWVELYENNSGILNFENKFRVFDGKMLSNLICIAMELENIRKTEKPHKELDEEFLKELYST
jgi:hypothetical protein